MAIGNSQELTRRFVLEQVATCGEKIQRAFSFSQCSDRQKLQETAKKSKRRGKGPPSTSLAFCC